MSGERWKDPVSGEEYWLDPDNLNVVTGKVRSGKRREDEKESGERWQAEAFLRQLGWPSESAIERPCVPQTHDFDCVNSLTGHHVALEIKRILPAQMAKLVQATGTNAWVDVDLFSPIRRLQEKAADQLKRAQADRKCVLLVWPYEDSERSPTWGLLRRVVEAPPPRCQDVDEWWLTTSACTRFWRL